jgi:4-diphosphocytidyl-2-C-methyl-D-erythritol kinase
LKIEIEACGKINLALDVLRKREDGYHEIKSIMQQVDLCDRLEITERSNGVAISCANQLVPLDHTNLVYRAWDKISKLAGSNAGINVKIDKHIPVAAGLAGGSTNGAATIIALNQMWDLGLSLQEMMEIGLQIGADIPFCIMGGTASAEGIGEKLTSLKPFKGKAVLIANPGIQISTAYAYSRLRIRDERIPIDSLVTCIEKNDLYSLANGIANVMEEAIISENPIIGQIKETMLHNGALGALMSGSGASVFGLYDYPDRLDFTYRKLQDKIPFVFKSQTI